MFCPECGESIEENAQFCPYCGASIEREDTPEETSGEASGGTYSPAGRKLPLIPILVAAAVVLGLLTGAVLYMTQHKKDQKTVAKTEDQKTGKDGDKKEEDKKEEEKKESLDPFEDLSVSFEGENGKGRLILKTPTNDGPATDYYFSWENDGRLSNGDTVVMLYDEEKQQKYYPGYEVTGTTKKYTVTGLTEPEEKKETPAPNYSGGVPSDLATSDSYNGYILWYSDAKYYDRDYLETLSNKQLRYARNEIFARYGREFNDSQLRDYFNSRDWYYPSYSPEAFDAVSGQILNQYEKANVNAIKAIEKERGN